MTKQPKAPIPSEENELALAHDAALARIESLVEGHTPGVRAWGLVVNINDTVIETIARVAGADHTPEDGPADSMRAAGMPDEMAGAADALWATRQRVLHETPNFTADEAQEYAAASRDLVDAACSWATGS